MVTVLMFFRGYRILPNLTQISNKFNKGYERKDTIGRNINVVLLVIIEKLEFPDVIGCCISS